MTPRPGGERDCRRRRVGRGGGGGRTVVPRRPVARTPRSGAKKGHFLMHRRLFDFPLFPPRIRIRLLYCLTARLLLLLHLLLSFRIAAAVPTAQSFGFDEAPGPPWRLGRWVLATGGAGGVILQYRLQ
jgi:hypothetical protein